MTLFRNFADLRQHKGNPFAPIQILTGDTREACNPQRGWLLDERRSFLRKSCIERRFESSPESRGSQTSGVLFGSFCTTQKERKNVPFAGSFEVLQTSISLKHGRLAHVRSQFSLFRRSPTHKNLPLATFCTSERAFWLLFARRKK